MRRKPGASRNSAVFSAQKTDLLPGLHLKPGQHCDMLESECSSEQVQIAVIGRCVRKKEEVFFYEQRDREHL